MSCLPLVNHRRDSCEPAGGWLWRFSGWRSVPSARPRCQTSPDGTFEQRQCNFPYPQIYTQFPGNPNEIAVADLKDLYSLREETKTTASGVLYGFRMPLWFGFWVGVCRLLIIGCCAGAGTRSLVLLFGGTSLGEVFGEFVQGYGAVFYS